MELMKEDSVQEAEALDKGELGAEAENLVTQVSEGGDARAEGTVEAHNTDGDAKIEGTVEGPNTDGDGSQRGRSDAEAENVGNARRSLEMRMVQEN